MVSAQVIRNWVTTRGLAPDSKWRQYIPNAQNKNNE